MFRDNGTLRVPARDWNGPLAKFGWIHRVYRKNLQNLTVLNLNLKSKIKKKKKLKKN